MSNLIEKWDRTSFYLNLRVILVGFICTALFVLSFFIPALFVIGKALLLFIVIAVAADVLLLYSKKHGISGERIPGERMSMGDENIVHVILENHYGFKVKAVLIDEIPVQFQDPNWKRILTIDSLGKTELSYELRPTERGEYMFNDLNVFVASPLRLVQRRIRIESEQMVKVYPSYIQMRRYQLIATSQTIQQTGVKKLRRLGHSTEYEQIREYVPGDDYRTINWKATARRPDLMVNNYTDEKSQQIYLLIDKGRVMRLHSRGLSLLDYSINAALMLAGVSINRGDKAGLITFDNKNCQFVPADKKPTQINLILETLYKQQTSFLEPDYELLFSAVRGRINHRSLLVLFTDFESMESLDRQLPYLRQLAHYHLLLVIFFDNGELQDFYDKPAERLEDIYVKTIAGNYILEKSRIVRELRKYGILSVCSRPEDLSINVLNKYLELKNRQSI